MLNHEIFEMSPSTKTPWNFYEGIQRNEVARVYQGERNVRHRRPNIGEKVKLCADWAWNYRIFLGNEIKNKMT